MTIDDQVRGVLAFMAANTKNRPLTYAEIQGTREHWGEFGPDEKLKRWERCRRRFAAAHPTLAEKDRVRHAAEALRTVFS